MITPSTPVSYSKVLEDKGALQVSTFRCVLRVSCDSGAQHHTEMMQFLKEAALSPEVRAIADPFHSLVICIHV